MAAFSGRLPTTENVLAHTDLRGFRILATGVSAGMGVAPLDCAPRPKSPTG